MKRTVTRAVQKIIRERSKNLRAIAKEINNAKTTKKDEPPKFEGRKNESINEFFAELCCLTQNELKRCLPTFLRQRGYENIICEDGFIYAKGDVPVLLTAHMDTVHSKPVEDYYELVAENGDHILYSPQGIGGDDRCGIYMILRIIEEYKCSVVFCEDEEKGCVGSKKFCKTDYIKEVSSCNYMIGLDRAHAADAVFYSCDNEQFTKFICDATGYKKEWGSYSDISHLAPAAGIAAVNLSCGYYEAHTTSEYVNLEEMDNTIDVVKFLLDQDCEQFEYIEEETAYDMWSYNNGFYGGYPTDTMGVIAYYTDKDGQESFVCGEGRSEEECWGNIFIDNMDLCMSKITGFEYY